MKEMMNRLAQCFGKHGRSFVRMLVLVMALVMVLALAGCKDDTTDPNDQNDPAVDQDDTANRVQPDPIVEPEGMEATFAKYKDVYAWIEVPEFASALGSSTELSYPVAQHPTDRDFYLNRDLDGNSNKAGTLFTEAVVEGKTINGTDLNDPVTVIYGHNMANRTMFGGLQTFLSKMDFSKQHLVYMYQKDRRVTYQIVGGVQYDLSHIIYYHDFTNDEVFNSFFDQLWKETDGTTNLDKDNKPVAGDKVLILSVCKNGDDNHRYLVVCKMIEDTADPTTWPLKDAADGDTAAAAKTDTSAAAKTDTSAAAKTDTAAKTN
jgi:sortase B